MDCLNKVLDVTSTNKDFYKLLASPLVDVKDKLKVIKEVFQGFDPTFVQFLCVVVERNRFVLLEQMEEEYSHLFW